MANYSINITDNGDGSFAVTDVLRAPSTVASGGTQIKTVPAAQMTFQELRDAIVKASMICQADRIVNG